MPYLTKRKKPNLIFCFFKIPSHIIPASAPMGVKNAPMLEPIMVEYKAYKASELDSNDTMLPNRTLIGILFIKFAAKTEVNPYTGTINILPSALPMIISVIPQ